MRARVRVRVRIIARIKDRDDVKVRATGYNGLGSTSALESGLGLG